jgi:phosphoribosyl 1,2-cyclic phosphodiesterase
VRVAILGSGSKGNCLVVDSGGAVVVVDVGFGPREVRRRLQHLGLDLMDIDAILITHAHGDHIKGARQLAGSLGKTAYATAQSARFASTFTSLKNHEAITPGERFCVGALSILPVKTCHDEPGSVAYVIDDGDEAFAVCTDLGDPSDSVGQALKGVDSLMLEFNHDAQMLKQGPYTAHLKRRIGSRYGHLENEASATLLKKALSPQLGRLLCAHLSEVNNTPELAMRAARAVVDGHDVSVAVAPQHAPTEWLRVRLPSPKRRPERVVLTATATTVTATVTMKAAATATTTTTAAPPSTATKAFVPLRQVVRTRQMALFGGEGADKKHP